MTIAFDGATKTATLSTGTTTMSVRDLWSRWVDWFLTSDNSKYGVWMTNLGGDDIDVVAGTSVPVFVFLKPGTTVKPQAADHTLAVTDGILVVEGGGDPFTNPAGSHVIRINYQQPVQVIGITSGSGLSTPQDQRLERIEKWLRNKEVLNPATGVLTVYDDDGTTPLGVADAFEDAAGATPYDGTGAVHRTERLA